MNLKRLVRNEWKFDLLSEADFCIRQWALAGRNHFVLVDLPRRELLRHNFHWPLGALAFAPDGTLYGRHVNHRLIVYDVGRR